MVNLATPGVLSSRYLEDPVRPHLACPLPVFMNLGAVGISLVHFSVTFDQKLSLRRRKKRKEEEEKLEKEHVRDT